MNKLCLLLCFAGLTLTASAEKGKPYNHLNYLDDPEEFHFAIVSDLYGADEKGEVYRDAFNRAVRAINTLRPEFVMSIGDLIPFGWLQDEEKVRQQHRVLDERISRIVPPFFCTAGNHDICPSYIYPNGTDCSRAYEISSKVWKEFRGPAYYSFVRKNVLFVVLNTDDDCRLGVRYCGISKEQYAWFKKTLDDNRDVRWTCVFMHLPQVWRQKEWLDFELANLVKRKYTVFAGDWHTYVYARRHGHDYYVLSVTGGCTGSDLTAGRDHLSPRDKYGEMDHIMWVTMTKDGPSIVNLDLDGVVAHDFITQKTSLSMGSEFTGLLIDYPEDPETWKHMEALQAKRAAILAQRKVDALRKKKSVCVSSLGNSPWDATKLIRQAIAGGGRTVVFDRAHSPWLTDSILVPSNVELVLEEGAELRAKVGLDEGGRKSLLILDGSTNVVIRGIGRGGVLRMPRGDRAGKQAGERMHAVSLNGVADVRIENLRILEENGGAGVNISAGDGGLSCQNVKIAGCQIENHGSLAVNVGSVDNLVVTNCDVSSDHGCALAVIAQASPQQRNPFSVRIEDCRLSGSSSGAYFAAHSGNAADGAVAVSRSRVEGRSGRDVVLAGKTGDAFSLRFSDCEFVGANENAKGAAFEVVADSSDRSFADNVLFENCTVYQTSVRPWCSLVSRNGRAAQPTRWRGSMRLVRPDGEAIEPLDETWAKSVFGIGVAK
ncbi:MAG: metallophosphoesterase [Kiritimatiellae bacterium]|nr:metallophosphoesterase [Kiritimatiellia bacterium]